MPTLRLTKAHSDSLNKLRKLESASEGTVILITQKLDEPAYKQVIEFVKEHSKLFCSLELDCEWFMGRVDFSTFDFAKECPYLYRLSLKRVEVNASIFDHPNLANLSLYESHWWGADEITLGCSSQSSNCALEDIVISDCLVYSKKLIAGRYSKLNSFSYWLDEDFSERYPDEFIFRSCSHLRDIDMRLCGIWDLHLRGVFPELRRMHLNSTQYGRYKLYKSGIRDGSSKFALQLKSAKSEGQLADLIDS